MRRVLIISFDAVGDEQFDTLLARPHFAALAARAAVVRGVSSVFLSNTYPVHTSIATGLPQKQHGLINNTRPFPQRHAPWYYEERYIRAQTLWQAAHEKGLKSAAVMWPVTGGSKTLRYNIPELMAQPGQNQLVLNMRYGSPWLQARMFLRHRQLLQGIAQPARDRFAAACMADILREKRPHLALMHLTAYDSLCHEHGLGSAQLQPAYQALDDNLGLLLKAAGPEYDVVLFSDHAQLPAENPLLPNTVLLQKKHITIDKTGSYCLGASEAFFECSGGSAFLHPGKLRDAEIEVVKSAVAALEGFGRFLSAQELDACGRAALPVGFAAKPGWTCEAYPTGHKANHGYPVDYDHYQVFYLAAGPAYAAGRTLQGGGLLQVTPLAARALGLDMPGIQAAREELFV